MLGQQQRQCLAHYLVGLEGAGIGLQHRVDGEGPAGQLHRHRRLRQRVDLEIASLHHGLELDTARHLGQGFRHRQQQQRMARRLQLFLGNFLFFFSEFRQHEHSLRVAFS